MPPAVIRPPRKTCGPRTVSPPNLSPGEPFFHEEKSSTSPTANKYDFMTSRLSAADSANPIEALEVTNINANKQKIPAGTTFIVDDEYFIFAPLPLLARAANDAPGAPITVKVSILFCVGDQMVRQGIRTFFDTRNDAVLITVPGTESAPRIGWGITSAMIDKLFDAANLKKQWEVHVIAGYSTGYRGMQGTVNNGKIPLDKIKTMIYYDCLYVADDYQTGFRTQDAVNKVRAASPSAKIVIYDSTSGGTTHPLPLSVPGQIVIDFKKANAAGTNRSAILSALAFARLLDEAIRDGFFAATQVPYLSAFLPLPTRGTIASDPAVPGAAGKEQLDAWGARMAAAMKQLNRADAAAVVMNHVLMSWRPPVASGQTLEAAVTAAVLHDQFMPEFGWEFLPPP